MKNKVLIAGGSGLIGKRLTQKLLQKGNEVSWLSRSSGSEGLVKKFKWDLDANFIEEEALSGADVIINLAGAGVADKRWTTARRKLIIESRVKGNLLILETIQKLNLKLKGYISSAAIGYYGHRGEEMLTEESMPGRKGFLPKSCIQWENAIQKIAETGIRTVIFRIGLVLSKDGGALPKIVQPIKFFTAPYFGHGDQFYSWIHIEDMVDLFIWAMESKNISGTFNAVAPNPVTNLEMVQAAIHRINPKAIPISIPEYVMRISMGEMADVVMTGSRVSSMKLQENGYRFQFETLEAALADLY